MSSRFDPEFYSRFRPFYPPETFSGLDKRLRDRGFQPPFTIADLGCGTGHSILSLLQTGIHAHLIGIDPDIHMLNEAKVFVRNHPELQWQVGSAEQTGCETGSLDAIIIGSAFHWMNIEQAQVEFKRILKPQGLLRVFEYQFPKARHLPVLNEWIRREFNLRWKAPDQKPRGSLRELTEKLCSHQKGLRAPFERVAEGQPKMQIELSAEDFAGFLLSQSRVLHYQDRLSSLEKTNFKKDIQIRLNHEMEEKPHIFDFKLIWFELGTSV